MRGLPALSALPARPSTVRLGLGAIGVLGILYGAKLLFDKYDVNQPFQVMKWAIGADVVVDGILLPLTIGVGWLLTKFVRPRARRYIQGSLIVMGVVTLVSLPLIHRRGKSAPGQALLQQNYALNLVILLGVIAGATLMVYVARVMRDQRASAANVRPAQDQTSSTE
jgi:hypothetical protein